MDLETRQSKRYRDAGNDYLFGTASNRFLERRAALFDEGHSAL